jgi:rieske iron-sulfur protein
MSDDCDECDGCCEAEAVRPSIYTDARAEMERRDYAKTLATVGGLTAVGSLAAPLAGLTRVFSRGYSGPIYSDGVALVDEAGERITEDALAMGEQMTVFPEPRPGIADAPTLLVRFPEDDYGGGTSLEDTVGGYAAYSKVCTHAGCMVSDREGDTLRIVSDRDPTPVRSFVASLAGVDPEDVDPFEVRRENPETWILETERP